MRFALLTAEPADVARGSGTAVAVARLRDALMAHGVSAPVLRPGGHLPQTLARARLHRQIARSAFAGADAVLGVNGDGWQLAERFEIPYVALIKAFYAGAAMYERGATRGLLTLHARWEAEGARRADAVVVPSRFAADAVRERYGVDPESLRVIPEAFDVTAWQAMLPIRSRADARVLCVAHLYPRKRVIDLLDAWPRVRETHRYARLDIVGGGPELRRLARRAQGLEGCYLHGHVGYPHILEFYARARVFCLPSAQETFGYAAVEAMASGLPLVIADAGALPEVCDGAVAALVPVGDPDAIARALTHALDDGVAVRAAAVNPRIARAFSPDAVAGQMIDAVAAARRRAQRRAGGSVLRRSGSPR